MYYAIESIHDDIIIYLAKRAKTMKLDTRVLLYRSSSK